MGAKKTEYMVLAGKPKGKKPLDNQDVGGRIIPKWTLEG
jgi:hypothetical protein